MRAARPWLAFAALLAVVGGLAAVGGFAYGHEPQRDVLELTVERASAADATPDAEVMSGVLVEVADNQLLLDTGDSPVALPLSVDAVVDELRRITDAAGELQPGASVNLGGERTDVGPILTGVVVLESTTGLDE